MSGRLQDDGSFNELKSFSSNYNKHSMPQYVQAEIDLLQMAWACILAGYHSNKTSFPLMLNDLSLLLFDKLIQTKRFFWQKVSKQALSWADARQGKPIWRLGAEGVQEASLQADPPIADFLPFESAYYIDGKQNQIGKLELSLPKKDLDLFLSCPPVSAELVPVFTDKLYSLLGEVFPVPEPIEVKRDALLFQPRMTLYSLQLPIGYGSLQLTDTAALSFIYGEGESQKEIPFSKEFKTETSFHDGVLHIFERDLLAERQAQAVMQALDFESLQRFSYSLAKTHAHHFRLMTNTNEASQWLHMVTDVFPDLESKGWQIVYDKSFRYQIVEPDDWYGDLSDDGGWFGLELGVMIEGKKVSLIPLLITLIQRLPNDFSQAALAAMPDDQRILLPYAGQQLALPISRVRSVLSILLELYLKDSLVDGKLRLPLLDATRILELEEALSLRYMGADRLRAMAERLRSFEAIEKVAPPVQLEASLRPYQEQGLSWLQFLREYHLNGILADDMGLGKTVQTLAHLLLEKEAGRAKEPSLVVAPTSLMTNWEAEAKRFTPDLKVLVLHGKERNKAFDAIAKHDLILTTYPLIVRDAEVHQKQLYHMIILDEAQYVKNPKTSSFKTVAALKANNRLCLSGTPIENHLGELWALFHFLMPGFLGSQDQFKQLYRTPIEKKGETSRQAQLAKRVKPFILRRDKASVAKDLPEKSEILVELELNDKQRDLYETVRVAMDERVREEVDKKGISRSQIMILDALLKLRQACCDPRLVKLKAAEKVKTSAKLEWLKDSLPQFLEEGHKVLIFSQFSSLLTLLEDTLQGLDISYSKLTGQTKDRKQQIAAFQEGDNKVFLITLKAGGVGLNLTAADTVIHFDPWWNPAAENQATDRTHRIGQNKPVFVYKLIAKGSIEERILKLQERKAALATGILEGSLKGSSLSQDDLKSLLAPLGQV